MVTLSALINAFPKKSEKINKELELKTICDVIFLVRGTKT
jgi:hypothetical protein